MRVKIGTEIYDSNNMPIMVILSDDDKTNIANMLPEATKYCSFPDKGYKPEFIKDWMNTEDD